MNIILTYNIAGGNTDLLVEGNSVTVGQFSKMSFQALGDNAVDNAVAVKLQEANQKTGSFVDVAGANVSINQDTDEYKDVGDFNSAYLNFNIDATSGGATAGIITIIITLKQ